MRVDSTNDQGATRRVLREMRDKADSRDNEQTRRSMPKRYLRSHVRFRGKADIQLKASQCLPCGR